MGCGGSKAAEAKAAPVCPEGDFKINVERTGDADTMGISIVTMSDNTIKITGLKEEGLVVAWNKTNEATPDQLVKEGDFILACNGVFGDAEAMKKELAAKTISVTLKRAPPPAAPAPAADAPAATDAPAADAAAAPADGAPAADAAAVAEPAAEPEANAAEAAPPAESAPADAAPAEAVPAEPAPAEASEPAAPTPARIAEDESVAVEPAEAQTAGAEAKAEEKLCKMSIC